MSLFHWFGKRAAPAEAAASHSDLGPADTTVPNPQAVQAPVAPARAASGSQRRNERVERRELLYGVVRECMNAAGVLSASYKFKVLSLDPQGRKYLIMMDVPRAHLADPAQFSVVEGLIARSAKERYDLFVTAVYWRVNEQVSAPVQAGVRPVPARPLPPPASAQAAVAAPTPVPAPTVRAASGEVQEEEIQAFKRAVAAAARSGAPMAQGELVRSSALHPAAEVDFSDTQPFENFAPLGTSQFGDLK